MTQVLVAAAYADQVQAEEAAGALEVWRRANRSLRLGPAAVLVKRPSNTLAYHPNHLRPGRAAVRGLFIGLVLGALPAAGAGGLVAFVLSTVVFAVMGTFGAISGEATSFLQLVATLGGAFLVALIAGALGAAVGCLVGLLVGFLNDRARGFAHTRRTAVARGLKTGASAVLLWSAPLDAPVLEDELRRLGGEPRTLWPEQPEADAFAAAPQPAPTETSNDG